MLGKKYSNLSYLFNFQIFFCFSKLNVLLENSKRNQLIYTTQFTFFLTELP
jgi:hypothetical protein